MFNFLKNNSNNDEEEKKPFHKVIRDVDAEAKSDFIKMVSDTATSLASSVSMGDNCAFILLGGEEMEKSEDAASVTGCVSAKGSAIMQAHMIASLLKEQPLLYALVQHIMK